MGKSNWIRMQATVVAAVGLAAVAVTHAEVRQPIRIETQNVSPFDAMGAFSFVYGGKSSSEFLAHWNLEQSSRQLDENRVEHTRTYRDPKTSLEIRSVAIEYKDFPALDWLLYLHNGGRENTPIIEKIEPLDLQLAGDREGFVLHYALGDTGGEYVQGFLSATSNFAPKKKVFKSDAIDNAYPRGNGSRRIPLVLAPNGGRSSDGYLPFFNLQWQKGGVVIALGWTGQWEASFGHEGEDVLKIQAGQQLTHFTLYPGETVRTPQDFVAFLGRGGLPAG